MTVLGSCSDQTYYTLQDTGDMKRDMENTGETELEKGRQVRTGVEEKLSGTKSTWKSQRKSLFYTYLKLHIMHIKYVYTFNKTLPFGPTMPLPQEPQTNKSPSTGMINLLSSC